MKLRNILFSALACTVLVIAAGDTGNGMGDTSGNGGQNGGMMDTITSIGTVMELSMTDSTLIVQSDTSTDTLFITATTQMPTEQELTPGTRVEVRYIDKDGRKELLSVKPQNAQGSSFRKTSFKRIKENGSNGSGEEKTLTGSIQSVNPEDSMIVVKTKSANDTVYFDENTKMKMDQLTEGNQVQVRYKKMDDRKVATEITMGSQQNGSTNGSKKSK